MPGFSIYHDFRGIPVAIKSRFECAEAVLRLNERYQSSRLLSNSVLYGTFTAYPQYPFDSFEIDQTKIFIEGAIYNKSKEQCEAELKELCPRLLNECSTDSQSRLREWVIASDGEYVVFAVDQETKNLIVFNDSLGRLPLFYWRTDDSVAIFREHKFLLTVRPELQFDRVGIGEFLVFGYNFGNRTMTRDVQRLEPASLIHVDQKSRSVNINRVYEWVFGEPEVDEISISDQAQQLAETFLAATKNRVDRFPDLELLLGLSGGLDSRAVLLGLLNTGVEFSSHTNCSRVSGIGEREAAAELAKMYSLRWHTFDINQIDLNDYLNVVRNQEGGSTAVMAVAIAALRILQEEFGRTIQYFTGDGGGNVMYPILPPRRPKSLDDLVEMTLHTMYWTRPEQVSRLLGISSDDLTDSIREAFRAFPETDLSWKFGHYKMLGRAWRFIMEGEDRTRFFYWLGAPFWDVEIMRQTMRISESRKSGFKLYVEFLRCLDPKSLEVKYSNVGGRPDSATARLYASVKSAMKTNRIVHTLVRRYRETRQSGGAGFEIAAVHPYLNSVVADRELVSEYFDVDELDRYLAQGLTALPYHLLTTVLMKIKLREDGFPAIGD